MKKKALILLAGMVFANSASATIVAGLNIVRTGCNAEGNTCIAILDTAIGPAACTSVQITWNGTTTPGRNAYATMLSARLSSSPIRINFDDNSCNGPNPRLLSVIVE